jgi:hypothetical protein
MKANYSKKHTLLLAALALVTLSAIVGWSTLSHANPGAVSPGSAPTSQPDYLEMTHRVASLNAKAKKANDGDYRAVQELTDEVLKEFGGPQMNEALSLFKDRVASSEARYRLHGNDAVSEGKLVSALNRLTQKVGAPDYAKVSVTQLRYLRVNLMTAYPSLISQSSTQEPKKSALAHKMSPLEAAALSLLIVTQKLSNEDFQVTPEQWAARRHQKQIAKWEAHRKGISSREDKGPKARLVPDNAKSKALEQAFRTHPGSLDQLIDDLLTEIGISAEGSTVR